MALPTLVKDWEIIENQTVTGDATVDSGTNAHRDRRNLLLAIKNQLVAAGTSDVGPTPGGSVTAWSVTQSCNGSAVNSSGDNWSTNLDLVWDLSGNTHSWIVLQQTGVDTSFQICIDCLQNSNSNDGAEILVAVAPGGYNTDGTTSSRPTPSTTDGELVVQDINQWSGSDAGGARDFVWHMWRSEDGSCTHIVIHYADNPITWWFFCTPQNPSSGWSGTQFVSGALGANDGGSVLQYADWYDLAQAYTWRSNRISTADSNNRTAIYFSATTFEFGPFGQELTVPNDITGEYVLGDIGCVSLESNFRGKMGSMFDVYWGQNVLGLPADNYPSGGAKNWVQFGALVFPWDGAAPITT